MGIMLIVAPWNTFPLPITELVSEIVEDGPDGATSHDTTRLYPSTLVEGLKPS